MIRRVLIPAVLCVLLAACGSAPSADNSMAATTNGSSDYLAKISQLNEKERNGVLFRAISDAGRGCQGVTRSVAGPAMQGNPSWIATCDDGTPWVVSINDQGVASVSAVAATRPKAG